MPVNLFPQSPLALFNGLVNKVAMSGGMVVICGLSNMDIYSPRLIQRRPLMSIQFTCNRYQY